MKRLIWIALWMGPALAYGPKEALAYQSPALNPAKASLEAARLRAGAVGLGLSSQLSASRNDGNNAYSASLNWQWDFAKRLEVQQSILRAEQEVRRVQREASKTALLAHANTWAAQAKLQAAQLRLEASQARLSETERKLALGAVGPAEREESTLALKQSDLALRQAQTTLQNAQTQAALYGLKGEASAQTLQFGLGSGGWQQNPSLIEAKLALELAESNLEAAQRSLWPSLNLGAQYSGQDHTLNAGAAWTPQGPSANVGLGSPLGAPLINNRWALSLGASLTIAPEAFAALAGLQAQRDLAAARLAQAQSEVQLRLSQARSEAAGALEALSLAQARLELSQRQTASIPNKLSAGLISPLQALEAQAQFHDSQAAAASAWQAYVAAVAAYLELSDSEWSVQP